MWKIEPKVALFPETTVIDSFLPSFLTDVRKDTNIFPLFRTATPNTYILGIFVLVFHYFALPSSITAPQDAHTRLVL